MVGLARRELATRMIHCVQQQVLLNEKMKKEDWSTLPRAAHTHDAGSQPITMTDGWKRPVALLRVLSLADEEHTGCFLVSPVFLG